ANDGACRRTRSAGNSQIVGSIAGDGEARMQVGTQVNRHRASADRKCNTARSAASVPQCSLHFANNGRQRLAAQVYGNPRARGRTAVMEGKSRRLAADIESQRIAGSDLT